MLIVQHQRHQVLTYYSDFAGMFSVLLISFERFITYSLRFSIKLWYTEYRI